MFTPEALKLAYYYSQGQPWLVNALARQAVEYVQIDVTQPITEEIMEQAKHQLILNRATHIDSLGKRLSEERVRHILEPMLLGDSLDQMPDDDIDYVIDLGLLKMGAGGLEVSNPIYKEVIIRTLTKVTSSTLGVIKPIWLRKDGTLDVDKLLESFLAFWRQHGDALMKSAPYHEAAPHLVLMAYLERVVNGEGKVHREYALGKGALDLYLEFKDVKLPIELKVWRPKQADPREEGLEQLDGYLDALDLPSGWLMIFDRRSKKKTAKERMRTVECTSPKGRNIIVIYA